MEAAEATTTATQNATTPTKPTADHSDWMCALSALVAYKMLTCSPGWMSFCSFSSWPGNLITSQHFRLDAGRVGMVVIVGEPNPSKAVASTSTSANSNLSFGFSSNINGNELTSQRYVGAKERSVAHWIWLQVHFGRRNIRGSRAQQNALKLHVLLNLKARLKTAHGSSSTGLVEGIWAESN